MHHEKNKYVAVAIVRRYFISGEVCRLGPPFTKARWLQLPTRQAAFASRTIQSSYQKGSCRRRQPFGIFRGMESIQLPRGDPGNDILIDMFESGLQPLPLMQRKLSSMCSCAEEMPLDRRL